MKQFSLEDIIRARLKMQSTQRKLDSNFNIRDLSFETISDSRFIKKFKSWELSKRKDFIYTIVGPVNMAKTFQYFEKMLENNKENNKK